ncbi:MAG: lipase, partial [Gemmatimonadaceae bacterium]
TDTAGNCSFTPCREIQIDSAFLIALNAGDETPGLVRYGTWRSPCDLTINPDQSVVLSGATNNESACINHIDFLNHMPTYTQVRDFVD